MNPTVEIGQTFDAKHLAVTFTYDEDLVKLAKSVQSAKWHKEEREWRYHNTEQHLASLLLKFSATEAKITLLPELKYQLKPVYELIKAEEERLKQIEILQEAKDSNSDFNYLRNVSLYPYQKVAIDFIEATNGKCILALDMGTGKSICSLAYGVKHNYKTLVICPATLKAKWKREIEKYSTCKANILKKSSSGFSMDDFVENDFHIINYDLLIKRKYKRGTESIEQNNKTLDDLQNILKEQGFDYVIVDEGQKMKNKKVGWTKFIMKQLIKIPHRVVLSGTPIISHPIEYFPLLKFVDPFVWHNEFSFAENFCNLTHNGFGYNMKGASNLSQLYKETRSYVFRRLKKDVLPELPEKTFTTVPIELTSLQRQEYNTLETNFSVTNSHETRKYTGELKLDVAIDFIEDVIESEKKIIVFSEYHFIIDALKKKFANNCVTLTGKSTAKQREFAELEFQKNDKIKCFFGTHDAAGVGIDLTASDIVLFIDKPWSSSEVHQCEDRACRIGQKNNVLVISLVVEGTIDQYLEVILEEKDRIISQALDNISNDNMEIIKNKSVLQELVDYIIKKNKEDIYI